MELNKLLKKKQKAIDDDDEQLIAETCVKIGNHYYNLNKMDKALIEFQQAANMWSNLNNKLHYAKAHRMLVEIYLNLNNLSSAMKHEDIYLKAAKESNEMPELQRAYATLGRIYLLKAEDEETSRKNSNDAHIDLKSAEKALLKSLIISKEISKDISKFELADMQSRIYLNLGVTKEAMKCFDDAIDYYKTALKICKTHDLFDLQHKCFMCIGLCYTSKYDDSSSALQNFNHAIEVAKRVDGKNEKICEALLAKSDLLIKNADFQSAKKVLKKAYKIRTSVEADMEQIQKNLRIVHALCKFEDDLITTDSFDYEKRKILFEKLGDGSCKLKNYKKSIDFYQKQLEAAELNGESGRTLIPIYISLYQTYIDMGEYEDAMKFLQLELELIKDEPKEACTTLMSLGNLLHLAKKDFWDIDAAYRKALCEARKANDTTVEKSIMKKLVTVCKENNMTSLAEILEQEALDKGIDINTDSEEVEMSEDLLDSSYIDVLDCELSSDLDSTDDEKNLTPKVNVRKKRTIAVKKNAKGETKLHEACINGNFQLAKMLLDQGHPVNIRDNAGWLCIHEASNHGYRDIVELILDHGGQCSINDKGGVNCDGITPLYDAASNGHLSVVQLLLDRGAKSTIKTDSNQTPLDALLLWYDNNKYNLSVSEKEFYDEIKNRLVQQCEKIGIDTTHKSISHASSGYSSIKSKNSQGSQRNNMRFTTKISDTSDNEQENDDYENEAHRINNDGDEDYIKKNARHEYKSVMQKLKHPHKDGNFIAENVQEPKKRSAYLYDEEIDVDEWLDDDLGPMKKKQKKFFTENICKSTAPRENSPVNTTQNDSTLIRKSSSNLISSDSDGENNENRSDVLSDFGTNSIDAFDVLMSTNGEGGNKKKSRRNSNTKLQRKSSNQSSLLDAGFSKFADFDDSSRKSYPSPIKVSSSSHNSSLNDSLSRSVQVEKQTIIKVQIGEEKIIVPINKDSANELKISWLIDESARRYYCLKGIRPELKLKTADGATLMDADPLSLILCLTEENLIFSEILDWKLPSLSNRYLEACSEYKCVVDRDVNEMLDLNRASINIDLSNQNLRPINIRPILKALHHQHCLTHIDLSSNFIQDEGIKYLAQALTTLKNIIFLDLSGNGITERGIEYLCNALDKSSSPMEIKQLKLDFNPIKSISLKHLSELCHSKSIASLSLVSCKLSEFDNEIESLHSLKELNISYNHFKLNGLRNLLRKLNLTLIESLNLERCSSELNIGDIIVNFITTGCCNSLKEINLSGLRFKENEILDILRCLQRCENLKLLDLSSQNEVTVLTMKYILFNMGNENLRVNFVGCQRLQNAFDVTQNFDQLMPSNPCHIKVSLPRTMKADERSEYVENVRNLWATVTESRGTIHQEKNILHLLGENRNVNDFL